MTSDRFERPDGAAHTTAGSGRVEALGGGSVLLLSPAALAARRPVAAGPLRPLAASLAADLEPLLGRDIHFPRNKALLSRAGGRCPRHGTLLDFDPAEPHAHRCAACGEVHRGELHDRFWIYWYQLWLAERAVHAALLGRLGGDERSGNLARAILDGYVERYLEYPNVDNVLGPSRLFFSTYLESIWLLQICLAVDLLDGAPGGLAGRVRDRVIEPARALIAEYDEQSSNRQVWNDAALLAAARLVGDAPAAERAVFGASGVASHLAGGLLADGTWFEGENYHLFAHRGLWYGVTMAERAGLELPAGLLDRFQLGFAAPFATALPDFTLPSRRDSPHAVSLRQWRIAEHCELGVARRADPALLAALARMYDGSAPRGDTGRGASSADVERNAQASALTRADLSWRALLCALPELPEQAAVVSPARSVLLDRQGIAVFRRNEGRAYVALDYGHSGGGHGHPDRLDLLLAADSARWLDDPGTGSYVDASLPWYRSTLAHNAPLVNGRSQQRVDGMLRAYDERGAAGWIVADAEVAPGVHVVRTVVVLSEYLIDELSWTAPAGITLDLPIHADLALTGPGPLVSRPLAGGTGREDGFRFLHDTTCQLADAQALVRGRAAQDGGETLRFWATSDRPAEWWRAVSLGAPGAGERAFRLLRARGAAGRHRIVMAWSPAVTDVAMDDAIVVSLADGTMHRHVRTESGWQIGLQAGAAASTIDLRYTRPAVAPLGVETGKVTRINQPVGAGLAALVGEPAATVIEIAGAGPTVLDLGEPHYRRSEDTWAEAGCPTARITLEPTSSGARLAVAVHGGDRTFVPDGSVNPYDNEPADINGAGIQLYARYGGVACGWMLVPELASSRVRTRGIEGWAAPHEPRAVWERMELGYRVAIELPALPDAIDVIVNEMPHGRARRRGQLVLSGAAGEFVYLRGDRHDPARLVTVSASGGPPASCSDPACYPDPVLRSDE